jgi:hypothetical protein
MLDFPARTIQTQSAPENAGTKHLDRPSWRPLPSVGDHRNREVDRLAQAIAKGRVAPETVADAINGTHADRVALRKRLESIETAKTPGSIHPAALTAYRRNIARHEELLQADGTPERRDLIATLRRLVERIVVHAPPRSEDLRIELHRRLAELAAAPAEVMGRGAGW